MSKEREIVFNPSELIGRTEVEILQEAVLREFGVEVWIVGFSRPGSRGPGKARAAHETLSVFFKPAVRE